MITPNEFATIGREYPEKIIDRVYDRKTLKLKEMTIKITDNEFAIYIHGFLKVWHCVNDYWECIEDTQLSESDNQDLQKIFRARNLNDIPAWQRASDRSQR